ncbi:MAG: PadR family transcriptional regulator [Anaerolineae bacterium]|nr:PadR family transcriptional regulator [Anaerolineae bacterium]
MTGYGIHKQLSSTPGTGISSSYGTLYPTLHKMQQEGVIDMEEIPQSRRPAKKLYRIAPAGEQELRHWLHQGPATDRQAFMLRLYLAQYLPEVDVLRLLRGRRRAAEATLGALCQSAAGAAPQNWHQAYNIALHEAECAWLRQMEARLQARLQPLPG